MRDNEFDNIFSKGLGEEMKQSFDEHDWEKLAQRLDDNGVTGAIIPQNTVLGWKKLLWLLPLLLLLIGGNVWSIWKANQAEQQNEALLNELKSMKNILEKQDKEPVIKTIIQKDTIIIYKFLPQTPTISDKINRVSLLDNLQNVDKNKLSINNSAFDPNKKDTLNISSAPLRPNFEGFISLKQEKMLQPLVSNKGKEALRLPTIVSASPIIKPTANNRFFVGASAGLIYYHSAWLNKDYIEIFRNEKSYQVGMKMEYAVTDNWRVTLAGDYCPFDFQIYWQDKRYNLPDAPTYYTNNPNMKFKSVRATQSLVQGSLGIKYYLKSNNNWRPFVGGAYTTMRILPFQAEYEFLETNRSVYGKAIQNTVTVNNILMLNAGLEYRLNPRVHVQLDVFYNKDINKAQKTYDLFGLRSILLFGFR